ncbi:S-methyl-5'-thioadenosine phosphorylase [Parasphingopyxis lamellibrachiae]|uniref:S-methyl-5'-thioadenosine phosphorylase n=1 Tax=Parasphingopyxis lamellibrachiae TaxID=680125 RepID=A0A3D9FFK3_9SPHN|nr:S-methyl-5'-thioadenosine phosphorylase [Parasphingopyxis lamellibrachiae]RED16523.1 methylthioadenosine phosphorylase [Parasphingopyxis lamellibrachiae]
MSDGEWVIGVVGGSGLYAIDALENAQSIRVESPWGEASDELVIGEIAGKRFVFLPRHGKGHRISPSDLNFRANVDVLKRAGCTDLISLSAVGSLREDLPPGKFVIVDQFVDRTFAREKSFFGAGLVAHVSMADPVCGRLSDMTEAAAKAAGADVHRGATYLAMEGPQFSSRAESELYRQWGCDVIGMTAMPEAKLAREAELPYALVAMVTDYDCWRDDTADVEVHDILETLQVNAGMAAQTVVEFAKALPDERPASPLDTVLDHAIITAPDATDPALKAKLDAVAGRVFAARAG